MLCTNCSLCKTRTHIVNGDGPWDTEYILIGEAPGETEDLTGKPFQGGAGRFLYSILKAAGIYKNNCFITNVVRCRPPRNRTPTDEEISLCKENLRLELLTINPNASIICLGEISAKEVTGNSGSYYRGYICTSKPEYGSRKTLITHHPAFLMRQQSRFPVVVHDILMLKEGRKHYPEKYLINPPYHIVKEYFDYTSLHGLACSVDIETAGGDSDEAEKGLNPYADELIGIGFCSTPGHAISISGIRLKECWNLIVDFLQTYPKLIIHTKDTFDNTFLHVKGVKMHSHFWNTATAMHLINSQLPRKLEFLRSLYTDLPPYKHIYKNPSLLTEDHLGRYNCIDVDATLRSYYEQDKYVNHPLMYRMMQEEDVALHMRLRGVFINQDALVNHYATFLPKMEMLEKSFKTEYGISISSNKQIADYLYALPDVIPSKRALKNKTFPSVDEKELNNILTKVYEGSKAHSFITKILSYREVAIIAQTYCEGVFKRIQSDGRVHPLWSPQGTDTGRWSCQDPNLQNIPHEMYDMIVASEGKIFLYADFDRVEVWCAAILSNDEDLLHDLSNNIDIHEQVRLEIAKSYPAITRTQAKAVVFGTFYGRGAEDLAITFKVDKTTASMWQEGFFNKYKKIRTFFTETVPREFETKGYLTSFYGRKKIPERITQAMNFPIQSLAADICNNALIALHKEDFNITIMIHDAIICEETSNERYEEFLHIIQTASSDIRPIFPASGGYGHSLNTIQEV